MCKAIEEYGQKKEMLGKMLGVIEIGKKLGWSEEQIVSQLVDLYKITKEAAKALLTPIAG